MSKLYEVQTQLHRVRSGSENGAAEASKRVQRIVASLEERLDDSGSGETWKENIRLKAELAALRAQVSAMTVAMKEAANDTNRKSAERMEDLYRLLCACGLYDGAAAVAPSELFQRCLETVQNLRERTLPDRVWLKKLCDVTGTIYTDALDAEVVFDACCDNVLDLKGDAERQRDSDKVPVIPMRVLSDVSDALGLEKIDRPPDTTSREVLFQTLLDVIRKTKAMADGVKILVAPAAGLSLDIDADKAKAISLGLSDAGCWMAGFTAALGEDREDREPYGHWAIREMNLVLKRAIAEQAGEEDGEIPF